MSRLPVLSQPSGIRAQILRPDGQPLRRLEAHPGREDHCAGRNGFLALPDNSGILRQEQELISVDQTIGLPNVLPRHFQQSGLSVHAPHPDVIQGKHGLLSRVDPKSGDPIPAAFFTQTELGPDPSVLHLDRRRHPPGIGEGPLIAPEHHRFPDEAAPALLARGLQAHQLLPAGRGLRRGQDQRLILHLLTDPAIIILPFRLPDQVPGGILCIPDPVYGRGLADIPDSRDARRPQQIIPVLRGGQFFIKQHMGRAEKKQWKGQPHEGTVVLALLVNGTVRHAILRVRCSYGPQALPPRPVRLRLPGLGQGPAVEDHAVMLPGRLMEGRHPVIQHQIIIIQAHGVLPPGIGEPQVQGGSPLPGLAVINPHPLRKGGRLPADQFLHSLPGRFLRPMADDDDLKILIPLGLQAGQRVLQHIHPPALGAHDDGQKPFFLSLLGPHDGLIPLPVQRLVPAPAHPAQVLPDRALRMKGLHPFDAFHLPLPFYSSYRCWVNSMPPVSGY